MAGRGVVARYPYWADRRIRQLAADNGESLSPKWGWTTRIRVAPFLPEIEIVRQSQDFKRATIASRIERLIGDSTVEDFVNPPPTRFARGTGRVIFAHFWGAPGIKDAVVMHATGHSSVGQRVAICLFGSACNLADYAGASDKASGGWSSSAAYAIEEFILSSGAVNVSQWDDLEALSMEALKIALHQGITKERSYHRGRPWTRGSTLGHTDESEWLAEIHSDVELTKGRWRFRQDDDDENVDRILIGAPLWIRTPKPQSVYRYQEDRERLEQLGRLDEN